MYWEDVLSSGPKLPSYIPVVSNYPQETCDTERGGSAPSLGTDGAKNDFFHQWNFLSVSLVFSLFHRRVWSNLVITAEQRDAQTCKLCWRIFRMAFPSWQHLLPHLHFMNILWCYCKWEFKQIVNTSLQFLRNGSVWIQHLSSLFPVNHCVLIRRRQQQLYISCMKLAMIG